MKKFLLVASAFIALTSCSSEESEITQAPHEVNVSLSYSLVESGSMTRNSGEVYSDFYEKYIKTKQLAPKTFELTFTNKETGATAVIRGDWNKKHSFKLLTGIYEVTGISHPQANNCIDSLYLCFNENVTITNETTGINLTANYDSYLLMFDKSDKKDIKLIFSSSTGGSGTTYSLNNTDNLYYAFIYELLSIGRNYISISRDGKSSSIELDDMPFEKGKYYYFNDISNSFDIPPMEAGK